MPGLHPGSDCKFMTDSFNPHHFVLPPEASLREVAANLDRNNRGVVLAVDGEGELLAVISDGDLRRALLNGLTLESPVSRLIELRAGAHPPALTAPYGTDPAELARIMESHGVNQLPLLDPRGRVADLAVLPETESGARPELRAVVMAGGFGKRLGALTEDLPKPMLPIGGRPLMELLIGHLREAGITRITVTTHYMPEKIRGYFGDGGRFGVSIDYIVEDEPLGTAGALAMLEPGDMPILVVNGDLLTRVNFRALLKFHESERAALTVGIRSHDVEIPYGVVETEGASIRRVREKPTLSFFVNAGVYLLDAAAPRTVPKHRRYDMTDLIDALIADGRRVAAFPIIEYWLDIGRTNDYEKALADYGNGSA
jgi:dTDP-glucose pyrophosphorylase